MVRIRDIIVGDRVKIVSEWDDYTEENSDGQMDHWLGQVMTVREIRGNRLKMVEDKDELNGDGWYWNVFCIDYVIPHEDEHEITAPSDDMIFGLFM